MKSVSEIVVANSQNDDEMKNIHWSLKLTQAGFWGGQNRRCVGSDGADYILSANALNTVHPNVRDYGELHAIDAVHGDVVSVVSVGQAYWFNTSAGSNEWVRFGAGRVGVVPANAELDPVSGVSSWRKVGYSVPDLAEYGLSANGALNADAWERCISENEEFTISSDTDIPMGRNIELKSNRVIRSIGSSTIFMENGSYCGWDGAGKSEPLKNVKLHISLKGDLRENDRPIFFIKSDRSAGGVLNTNPIGADCYDFDFDIWIVGSRKTGQGAVILGAYSGILGLKVQQTNTAMILDQGPRTSYGINGVGFTHFELQGNYRAGWIRDFQAVNFPSKAIVQGHFFGLEILGPGRGLRLPNYYELNANIAQHWADIPKAQEIPGTIFRASRLPDGVQWEYQFPHDFEGRKGHVWNKLEEARYLKLGSANAEDKYDLRLDAVSAAETPTNIILDVTSTFAARRSDEVPHAIHLVRGRGLELSGSFEGYTSNPITNKSVAPEDIQGSSRLIYGKYDNPWSLSQLPAIDVETARFYEKERVKGQIVLSAEAVPHVPTELFTFKVPSMGFNQTAMPVVLVAYGKVNSKGINKLLQIAVNGVPVPSLFWNSVNSGNEFELEIVIIPMSNVEQKIVGKATGFGNRRQIVKSQSTEINTLNTQLSVSVVGTCNLPGSLFIDVLTWDKGHA